MVRSSFTLLFTSHWSTASLISFLPWAIILHPVFFPLVILFFIALCAFALPLQEVLSFLVATEGTFIMSTGIYRGRIYYDSHISKDTCNKFLALDEAML